MNTPCMDGSGLVNTPCMDGSSLVNTHHLSKKTHTNSLHCDFQCSVRYRSMNSWRKNNTQKRVSHKSHNPPSPSQSRLAVNSVILGDYQRPFDISTFVSDLSAGFRLLNLKNDALRKKFDSLKYDLKKIEEVVYDISIRGLKPQK